MNKSVTFSRLGEHGRLGNQLWQYAFLRAYKERTGYDVYLPILHEKEWHGQKCLLNCFNIKLPQRFSATSGLTTWMERDPQEFNPLAFKVYNVDFQGFFQNTKYFEGYEHIIKKEFTLKAGFDEIIKTQLSNLRNLADGRELVSVHIRRGDLVEQTKNDNFFGGPDSIHSKYLQEALSYFPKDKYCFLIFTGGSRENEYDSDMNWCKENLPFDWEEDYVKIYNTKNTIIDFATIYNCDHNIMSHASSFSWWAAFLNKNPNKKVIAPKHYFIDRRDRFVDGFYPKEFTLI